MTHSRLRYLPLPAASFALLPLLLLGSGLLGCGGGGSGGPPDAGPPPVDQCQNANDLPIAYAAAAFADGGAPDAGSTDAGVSYASVEVLTYAVANCVSMGECAALLLAESPELGACIDACLVGTPAEGLTEPCADCWTELTWCAVDNCLVLCADDLFAPTCSACTNTYCVPRFNDCTGFHATMP